MSRALLSNLCNALLAWSTGAVNEVTAIAGGVRARVREEMRREILDAARRRLALDGSAALSLRAVARDVGLVSSAVYRYVPSRDALLTELIVEAYTSFADTVTAADAAEEPSDFRARWTAIARSTRTWAVAHPHQWALIYGSPVPGYVAPEDTIQPAIRVPLLLAGMLSDAWAAGAVRRGEPVPGDVVDILDLAQYFAAGVPPDVVVRGLGAWTYVVGSVSAQLFGQRHRVIAPDAFERFYEEELRRTADMVGFAAPA